MSEANISHIFIIPYKNREEELKLFYEKMIPMLEQQIGNGKYKIILIHQLDYKMFNRGALLNIGFSWTKNILQKEYKTLNFISHDVDIYITKPDALLYDTELGEVRHPYGDLRPQFGGILGCLCIIKGYDFERVGGYPNYFGWGGEDVCLARRCLANNIKINEDNFINRRSSEYIIDPESHPTEKQKQICNITDQRNLRECFKENHLQPINTWDNVDYNIEKIHNPLENKIYNNTEIEKELKNNENIVFMLDVNFNVRC